MGAVLADVGDCPLLDRTFALRYESLLMKRSLSI